MSNQDQIRQQLYYHARELVPFLKKHSQDAASNGYLHKATIADFQEAGFFRILQPAKWGSYELEPQAPGRPIP